MSLASRSLISLVTGLLLALGLLAVVPTSPATAASTTLCSGWSTCAAAGYSDAGYGAANKNSYWRMYGGHNCTNYVAYRMVLAGMSSTRPFAGTGNAWNWGVQMASKTDSTPSVGAVAWWNKGVSGAGSVGHVAYVEQVISPTEIVISEDSWSGDFHWRRLTAGSGWPSGFIHLVDKPILNTAPVTVTGTPAVGQTLGSTPGTWAPASNLTYQWYANGAPIAGEVGPTLKLSTALGGATVVLRVGATQAGFTSASADSPAVTVALGALAASGAPVLDGLKKVPMVGDTLSASKPTFTPTPRASSVQWYADGAPIAGATDWSFQLTGNEVGHAVSAVATGKRPGYSPTPASSAPTGAVKAGRVEIAQAFAVVGKTRVGKTLEVAPGKVSPSDATMSYAWLRNSKPIAGATGASYVVAPEDSGKQISVRVAVGRTNYLGRTKTAAAATRVASKPTIVIKTAGRKGRATVLFKLTAPGVAKPTGLATVTVGATTRTVKVVDGVGRLGLKGLAAGKLPVRVAWNGTGAVLAGAATGEVRVRR